MNSLTAIGPLLAASLLLLWGCSSAPNDDGLDTSAKDEGQRQEVVDNATALIGTPYRYGGANPDRGFDCSGLVHYVYLQAGRKVPRTVSRQKKYARPVQLSQVRPGDLLFFDTRADGGHIGIYLGEGRFVHAPSTGGSVRIDRLNDAYWRNRVLGAGGVPGV